MGRLSLLLLFLLLFVYMHVSGYPATANGSLIRASNTGDWEMAVGRRVTNQGTNFTASRADTGRGTAPIGTLPLMKRRLY